MLAWGQWLMPVILVTWEADIGRIAIQGQPRQKKFARFHLSEKIWVYWHALVSSVTAGNIK
jgi:hypothetical protein